MVNRRRFLKQAAGASAFLAASPILARSFPQLKPNPVRLSVCIDMILTEIPFLQRMETVKRLGYPAFEFWEWKNKDVDAILRKKDELGLEIWKMLDEIQRGARSQDVFVMLGSNDVRDPASMRDVPSAIAISPPSAEGLPH